MIILAGVLLLVTLVFGATMRPNNDFSFVVFNSYWIAVIILCAYVILSSLGFSFT